MKSLFLKSILFFILLSSLAFSIEGRNHCIRKQAISSDLTPPPASERYPGRNSYLAFKDSLITTNFVIFFTKTGVRAIQNANIDANVNGYPDKIDSIGILLEDAWDFYMNKSGMPKPPLFAAQKYPVYIDTMSYYGFVQPTNLLGDNPNTSTKETKSIYSYMSILNQYDIVNGINIGGFAQAMKPTITHEFFHVIQLGVNSEYTPWFLESSATAMENIRHPENTDNMQFLGAYTQQPDLPIEFSELSSEFNNLGINSPSHEYSVWPFFRGLYDHYSGMSILKEITDQYGLLPSGSSQVITQMLDTILKKYNSSFQSELQNFFVSQLRMSTTRKPWNYEFADQFKALSNYSSLKLKIERNLAYTKDTLKHNSQIDGNSTLWGKSADFFSVTGNQVFSFHVSPQNKDTLGIILVQERSDSLSIRFWDVGTDLIRNIDNPLNWTSTHLIVWNKGYSAKNSAYNLNLEPKSSVGIIQNQSHVFNISVQSKQVQVKNLSSETMQLWSLYKNDGTRVVGGIIVPNEGQAEIDLRSVSSGVYILQIQGSTTKFMLTED